MYVKYKVNECDFTGREYGEYVNGAGAISQGATGRWCVVMFAGPEYLAKNNIVPSTHEEALAMIKEKGGYADF